VTLFQRRPFALTPAGQKLYQFIQPFFANLDLIASELQGGKARQIRIGASTIVLREHLPEVFQNVRKRFPNLKISLREGYPMEFENLLQMEELDLAITAIEKKPAPGLHSVALVKLPLVLLVPKGSRVTAAGQLWEQDKIAEPLICLPAAEALCKNFQQGLARLGVDWFPSMEVSSVDLIETYVANGFGIGLSVQVPNTKLLPTVRGLPLPDFAPVVVGALWRGKTSALLQAFLDEFQLRAKRFAPLTAKET
jgi:DNA-binding transcriptional LysR family regulator